MSDLVKVGAVVKLVDEGSSISSSADNGILRDPLDGQNLVGMVLDGVEWGQLGSDIPELDSLIVGGGDEPVLVGWMPVEAGDPPLVRSESLGDQASMWISWIPQADAAIVMSSSDEGRWEGRWKSGSRGRLARCN